MKRINYRTVKNNKIQLFGRTLGNANLKNGELDGKRFCFIPYKIFCFIPYTNISLNSGFSFDGSTALWGTEAYSRALNKESKEVIKKLADESDKILAPDGYFRWYFWEDTKKEEKNE